MFTFAKRISQALLLISVTPTPNLREGRIQEILDYRSPGRELEASRADVYSPGGRVSIEGEAATTHAIQGELDKQVADENLFDDTEAYGQRRQPPCIRFRKEG